MYYDRTISASMREQNKLACALELKSIDLEGRFAGYASVFNVLDNQKDVILRGAFADTIRGRVAQIKLLWQHQTDEPIGYFSRIFEDSRGLYVEGQLLLQVARAREALALLKSGALSGLSIGYSPIRYTTDKKTGVRRLAEVALWEVSLVTFPANEQAGVTVVKGRPATRRGMRQLAAISQKGMEELWAGKDAYLMHGDTLPAECFAIRRECDWIKTYVALLQAKMFADRELAGQ